MDPRGSDLWPDLQRHFAFDTDGSGAIDDTELAASSIPFGYVAEQLEGMAPGERKEIEVTFPADYGSADLAGKPAVFSVTAKAVKTKVLPELDDAFARSVGFPGAIAHGMLTLSYAVGQAYQLGFMEKTILANAYASRKPSRS